MSERLLRLFANMVLIQSFKTGFFGPLYLLIEGHFEFVNTVF